MAPTLPQTPGFRVHLLLFGAGIVVSACARADDALLGPMASRNLSPLYANLGVPVMENAGPMAAGSMDLDWTLHWASHAVLERSAGGTLEFDGETRRQDFRVRVGLGKGTRLSVNIPYIHHSGGQLDGLIDNWHALWGMPDGPRAVQPRDALRFRYPGDGTLNLEASRGGVGDVEVGLSAGLLSGESWDLGLFGQYKFSTGRFDRATGSDEDSVAFGVRVSRRACFFDRLSCHGQWGAVYTANSRLDAGADSRAVFSGISLAWQLDDALAVLAQLDAHTGVYDAAVLRANGAPVWGTLGLRWRPLEHWRLDAQFIEDLAVGSAPDVTFRLAVSRSF